MAAAGCGGGPFFRVLRHSFRRCLPPEEQGQELPERIHVQGEIVKERIENTRAISCTGEIIAVQRLKIPERIHAQGEIVREQGRKVPERIHVPGEMMKEQR